MPKLIKPLTADGATGGIKGNYPSASTASPPEPKTVKVDIPLINKGEPNFSNFGIPDMDAALNPPQTDVPLSVPADANSLYGNSASTEPPGIVESFFIGMWSGVHNALDIAGIFVPGIGDIADGANALIYLAEGDKINAGISVAAMVPVVGIG
ncbi:MAG: hypothetical protein LBP87_11155, partial [Planctomycetaceae bacterium]|nr:hypothetical protein [Planctomycetaceae bacterium]